MKTISAPGPCAACWCRTNNRLILIDNGIGDKQDAKFLAHYYLHGDDTLDTSLTKAGFHRDDITDVFLTHLHFDHCGGSIERKDGKLIPAFKNAIYWSNLRHWEWATQPNDREKASFLKENILPIQESGQLKFVEPNGWHFIYRKYQRAICQWPYRSHDAAADKIQRTNDRIHGRPAALGGAYTLALYNGI